MITKNKTKDVFLTKKQLQARIEAGTFEEGVIYNTTDEPAGHSLKYENGVLSLLDIDGNAISQVSIESGGVPVLDTLPETPDETTPNVFYCQNNLYVKTEEVIETDVYGVDGVGNESYTLTRTDANVGLDQTSTDLHDFFVANEDVTDSNGNHFVQLKKFYVKITKNVNGSFKYQVSHAQNDDEYFLCPMFYDKDGNEIDYAYYGKYKGYVTSSRLYSQSGKTPTYSTTIDNFMTYARNNNSNEYYAIDWATAFTAQIMFMIVYASTKYDAFFTYRSYGATTGSGGTASTFLGIEDMVGNGFELLVNVSKQNGGSRFYYKDYIGDWTSGAITSGNYFDGAPTSSDYQSKHLYNADKPIATMFPSELDGSSTTFYCDYYYYSANTQLVYWGAYSAFDTYGLFYLNCYYAWSNTNSNLGSRLCAKKLI